MINQRVLSYSANYLELDKYLITCRVKNILLVCGQSIKELEINEFFSKMQLRLGINVTQFSDFTPNPNYSSVVKGINELHTNNCDCIIAVGGGSAIDVAKSIKAFCNMDVSKNYLHQNIINNDIKLIAIPTTAGTGSEATHFAVIYYNGEKQSIAHESCLPEAVVLDPRLLNTLPLYQRKVTMLDALCHSIESFWAIKSTEESKVYSKQAIELILYYMESYLANDFGGNEKMLLASHIAGKAINITTTTAGHAMAYKLSSMYGIPHGHAVALALNEVWPYMLEHMELCVDVRGIAYLEQTLCELSRMLGGSDINDGPIIFKGILAALEIKLLEAKSKNDIGILTKAVNPHRLKNNPIAFSDLDLQNLYESMLQQHNEGKKNEY